MLGFTERLASRTVPASCRCLGKHLLKSSHVHFGEGPSFWERARAVLPASGRIGNLGRPLRDQHLLSLEDVECSVPKLVHGGVPRPVPPPAQILDPLSHLLCDKPPRDREGHQDREPQKPRPHRQEATSQPSAPAGHLAADGAHSAGHWRGTTWPQNPQRPQSCRRHPWLPGPAPAPIPRLKRLSPPTGSHAGERPRKKTLT